MLRIVALKLYSKSYDELATLASVVVAGFTAAAGTYTTPFPALMSVTTSLTSLNSAIDAWGQEGNHGSHVDLVNLRAARGEMRMLLTQLAAYAEDTTPGDRVALASIGWELKSFPHKIGVLQAVQGLHQFLSRRVDVGTLKLKWKRPLNAVNVKVSGYRVMRSATSSFAGAAQIGITTKTSFVDTDPGTGYKFYWVIPFNGGTGGDGVLSDVCMAIATPLPA